MITPPVVIYPVEPGFIWFRWSEGLFRGWTGSREHLRVLRGGIRVRVAQLQTGRGLEKIYFCHAHGLSTGKKGGALWAERLSVPAAQHHDLWGLPDKLGLVERGYLEQLISRGYTQKPCGELLSLRPLTFRSDDLVRDSLVA